MSLVAFFVFIGKVSGALKEIVLAWRYGIDSDIDVYVFALVFVMWLPSVCASVLTSVLVPALNQMGSKNRKIFLDELTGATCILAGFALLFLIFILPIILPKIATGFSESSLDSLAYTVKYLAPVGALKFFVSLFSAQLLAQERHANTLLEAVPSLVLCIIVYLWQGPFNLDPLIVGSLVGIVIQVSILFYLLKRGTFQPSIIVGFSHPAWKTFLTALLTISAGTIVMSLMAPIDQILAARLEDGSVATYGYANRMLALVLGLGATAVARAILPVLSDYKLTITQRADLARKWSLTLFLLGIMMAAISWFFGPAAVATLFERGAFTSDDSARVARVFQIAIIQLPFYFAGIVLVQFYASAGKYRLIALSSCLAVAVKMSSGPYLITAMGLDGLALSTVLAYVGNFVLFKVAMYTGK